MKKGSEEFVTEKILFGVNFRKFEERLKVGIQEKYDYEFVGAATTTEGVLEQVRIKKPTILILREKLQGELSDEELLLELRNNYEEVRIIYLAGNHEVGDPFLSQLVSLGIYDIVYGEKISFSKVMGLVAKANKRRDVAHLQQSLDINTGNAPTTEKTGEIPKIFMTETDLLERKKAEEERKKAEEQAKKEEEQEEEVEPNDEGVEEEPIEEEPVAEEKNYVPPVQDIPQTKQEIATRETTTPTKTKTNEPKKKSKIGVIIGAFSLLILLGAGIVAAFIYFGGMDILKGDDSEEILVEALRLSSTKDYEQASVLFDQIDYTTLEEKDKDIMLLTYLFSDQPIKALNLEPKFINSVINYYYAKENTDMIYELAEEWEDPNLDFEVAVLDEEYEKIIELQDDIDMKDRQTEAIVKAYLHLDDLDGAKEFAIELDREELFDIIEEFEEEKKRLEEEQKEKERQEHEKEAEEGLKQEQEKEEGAAETPPAEEGAEETTEAEDAETA